MLRVMDHKTTSQMSTYWFSYHTEMNENLTLPDPVVEINTTHQPVSWHIVKRVYTHCCRGAKLLLSFKAGLCEDTSDSYFNTKVQFQLYYPKYELWYLNLGYLMQKSLLLFFSKIKISLGTIFVWGNSRCPTFTVWCNWMRKDWILSLMMTLIRDIDI